MVWKEILGGLCQAQLKWRARAGDSWPFCSRAESKKGRCQEPRSALLSASLQKLPCMELTLGAGVAIGYRVHSQGWDLRDAGSGQGDLIVEGGTLFRPMVHNLGVCTYINLIFSFCCVLRKGFG